MARVAGVNLPKDKRIEIALTAIFGIGRSTSQTILTQAGINFDAKTKDLTEAEVAKIRELVGKYPNEGDLKRKVAMDIKHLQEIGTLRGYRHKKGLPVRGQNTQTNCRTRKGKRKTVANKKKATK